MKKLIIVAALAGLSSSAFAAGVCNGASAAGPVTVAAGGFIKTTFKTACSSNVVMDVDATTSTTAAWAEAGSNKGACFAIGHTDAGVRQKTAACSPTNSPEISGSATGAAAASASGMAS